MKTLTLKQFLETVNDGKIFGVEFTKKTDGTLRKMQCRRGVSKGVKGVRSNAEGDFNNNVLTVYDVAKVTQGGDTKGAFRRINLAALRSASVGGTRYSWDTVRNCFAEVK